MGRAGGVGPMWGKQAVGTKRLGVTWWREGHPWPEGSSAGEGSLVSFWGPLGVHLEREGLEDDAPGLPDMGAHLENPKTHMYSHLHARTGAQAHAHVRTGVAALIHVHGATGTRACRPVHMCTCIWQCTHTHTHLRRCMYTTLHACTRGCTHMHTHVHTYTRTSDVT